MKLSYISLAVAAAFAVGDASATTTEPTEKNVWASGASAPTRAVYNAFVSNCTSAGHTIYMSGGSSVTQSSRPGDSGTGNFYMYRCTLDGLKTTTTGAPFTTWDGKVLNMYHTVDGGSFNLFAPHLPAPTAVGRLGDIVPPDTITTLPGLPGCILATGGTSTPGVTVYRSCTVLAADINRRPDGGYSDVEDELWPNLNQGINFIQKSVNVSQAFGVAVTDALYTAMQNTQIAAGFLDVACAGNTTPSSASGSCQPSISEDQYRSIISSTALGAYHADWGRMAGDATKKVRVCRRVESSGTQASSTAYFLENPCRQWNKQIGQLQPSTSLTAEAEELDYSFLYDVVENSSTSDVKACLNNSNNMVSKAGSTNGVAGDYVSDATTTFAIGVMSMENVRNTTTDNFRFLRLNHVSPNFDLKQRAAAAQGQYGFVMEMVYWGVPNTSSTTNYGFDSKQFTLNHDHNTTDTAPALNTEPFFTELAKDMSSTTILDLNGLFISPLSGAIPNGDDVGYGTKLGTNCRPQELL